MDGRTLGQPVKPTRIDLRGGDLAVYRADPPARNGGEPDEAVIGYLHGMLGNPGVHPFLTDLAAATGRSVVAPCLPGFGASSPRDDLRNVHDWVVATSEVIDLSGLAGAPLVAASVGALLALELAAVRPEAFSQLVLIAPLGLWDDAEPIADVFAARTSEQPALLLADPDRARAFFVDDPDLDAAGVLDQGVDRYFTRRAAASLVWPIPDHGLAERIHRVSCPVALVWGAEDRVIPPSYADRYAARLTGCQARQIVADAGHCAEWDAPDAVAAIVADALRRPLRRRGVS